MNNDYEYKRLSFWEKIKNSVKEKITNFKKNYKFPWVKVTILVLVILIIFVLYLVVTNSKVKVTPRKPYDMTGFVDARIDDNDLSDDSTNNYYLVNKQTTTIENNNYKFVFNNVNTTFELIDLNSNNTWQSNLISQDKPLIVQVGYKSTSLGGVESMNSYLESVKYNNYSLRINDNSLEVLYTLGGKRSVDESDFPKILSLDRMNDLILSKLEEGSTEYKRITKTFYVQGDYQGKQVWTLKDGIQASSLTMLYGILYNDCGYTKDDLAVDNKAFGIKYEDTYPIFNISVKYSLTENGLDVKLINEGITEKEKFPLLYIDLLPFFGAGSNTDNGYIVIGDGSGVLIDFNTTRPFSTKYQQRIYGEDLAKIRDIKSNEVENINLPIIGIKKNNAGMLTVVEEGASMAEIISDVYNNAIPYNYAHYRVYYREGEAYDFSAVDNRTKITYWTPNYNKNDFSFKVLTVNEDNGSYYAMAKELQKYLVDNGVLTQKDHTSKVSIDLNLLGGYISKENFIGFSYDKVRTLTTYSQIKKIINELITEGIDNINVIYKGWSNDGLKPTCILDIDYNSSIITKKNLKSLEKYINGLAQNIELYPEVFGYTAYTGENIIETKQAVRDVFGNIVKNYSYNNAILYKDVETRPIYILKSTQYNNVLKEITKEFKDLKINNVAFNDFGNKSYGTYASKNTSFRDTTIDKFTLSMDKYNNKFENIVLNNPCLYSLKYATSIQNLPEYGTEYIIVSYSIPFYQLVLNGYIDYSSKSFNIDDNKEVVWHKMKAIETGSNINYTWSYSSTIGLTDTEYAYYYSTYYLNTYDELIKIYKELNDVGVYSTTIKHHQVLNNDGTLTKTTYNNGMEIVFNYSIDNQNVGGTIIAPNTYKIVKEAD